MTKSLQKIVEDKTYSIIDYLENELDIEINKRPEVHYIWKNFDFNKIGYPEAISYLKIDNLKKNIGACLVPKDGLIFTSSLKDSILAEEAGHFIHSQFIDPKDLCEIDYVGKSIIQEMIGFFCSKLVDFDREKGYNEDVFKGEKINEFNVEIIKLILKKNELDDFFHQQGYLLGERLYHKYIQKEINLKQIKKIIKKPLNRKYEGFLEFHSIRNSLF